MNGSIPPGALSLEHNRLLQARKLLSWVLLSENPVYVSNMLVAVNQFYHLGTTLAGFGFESEVECNNNNVFAFSSSTRSYQASAVFLM